jgi:hypothetical protein
MSLVIPKDTSISEVQQDVVYDSTVLKTQHIYICDGHYFEWCNEASFCGHCNEPLNKIDLWSYYKKLECEDCQKFFEDNYETFVEQAK